ncbi:MAG: hypothetical protein ACKKL5_02225 [Candidatus Komeilibacteria bacterium]
MNNDYLRQIKEIFTVDQEVRLKCKPGKELPNYLVYLMDIAHNYRIHLLINQYGYPTKKSLGKRGMKIFTMLILHQWFDIALQEDFLANGQHEPAEKAALIDRIRFNMGKKQLYGTMLNVKIEDIKNVDKRRKKMNLNTLKQYLTESKKKLNKIKKIKKFKYYNIK